MAAEHDPFPRTLSKAVHELRNILGPAQGYLRMLLKEQGGPISRLQRKWLKEIEHSCGRIDAFASEMSELQKLESGTTQFAQQAFDLKQLVAELANDVHDGDDRGVRLEVRGADPGLGVVGDRSRLGAAVRVLLRAAVRERGEPGVIIAECSITNGKPPSALLAIGDEATVRALTEADGVPFNEWPAGLGLAPTIARRVVEAHGGSLWSAPGDEPGKTRGSALRLPLRST